jgi:ankyrin repeat protein
MLLGMRKNVPALEHELPDALICAAKGDHMEIVTLLLEAGVSIKPCEKDRTTEAMFELASNGGHAELLGLLVHRYCMGTTSHFHHDKVLNWAAEKGYALVVETLLQMWITHTDDHLHNALCVAALHGHENVAKALLNAVQPATAAKTSTNDLPKLPPVSSTDTGERLHAASGSRGQPIPSPLESHELRGPWIEPCPQRKKIIDGFSISGLELNALQIAARKGHLSTCSLLLDAGADANAFRSTQMSGCLPINQALEGGHFEVAKLLLERGANPDGRVPFTIPFAVAIRKGIQELIYLLVAKGARLNMDEEVTYIQRGGFLSRRPKVKHSTLFAFAKEFGPDWAVDFLKDMNYLSLTDRKRTANRWLEQHGHEGADAEGNESNKRYSGHSMQSCKIHYEQPGQNSGPCSPIAPPPSPSPPLYPAVLSPELLASTDSQLTDSSNSLCLLTLDGADFRKSEETIKDASSSIIVKELI